MRAVCTVKLKFKTSFYPMRAVCTVKLKFLVSILAHLSSVHCKNEIFNCHFSVWEQCALSNWNFFLPFQCLRAVCTVKLKLSMMMMRAVCTAKMKFLIVILPNRSSVQCKIKILTCHYSVWKQCAMSKMKFLAFIYPMRAVCTAKMKLLVVILPNESGVHCKIEISSHHFTP